MDYWEIEAVNQSLLKNFFKSPAHVKAYADGQCKQDTSSMGLGTLQHMALLEPEKLQDAYIAAPDFGHQRKTDTTTTEQARSNREAKAEWYENNQDKEIIPAAEFEKLVGMSGAIWSNAECKALLKSIEMVEMPVVWEDNGVKCKALIDMYSPKGLVVDLKTTDDCRHHRFQSSAVKYGYFFQAAFYLRGCQKAGLKAQDFIWIVVESKAPYAVQLFTLPDIAKISYENVIDVFLMKYNACTQTGHWPAYSTDFRPLEVPDYHINQLEAIQ